MTTTTRPRLAGLDQLRGVAVLLMVLDHALLVGAELAGGAGVLTRITVTRASLPLFCLVAGALMGTRPRWRRLAGLVAAGGVATALGRPLGISQPDVLLVLAAVLALAPFLAGRALWWVAVAVLVASWGWAWPWVGYNPALVLALVLLGAQLGAGQLDQLGSRLPPARILCLAGRYPLTAYLGHLTIIGGIAWLV